MSKENRHIRISLFPRCGGVFLFFSGIPKVFLHHAHLLWREVAMMLLIALSLCHILCTEERITPAGRS